MVFYRVCPISFTFKQVESLHLWRLSSGCAHEITDCMAKYIRNRNPNGITLNSKVTSIALKDNTSVDVTTNDKDHHQLLRVISTIPLPVLLTIDFSQGELSSSQSNVRELNYGPSVEIGLQFKTAWWTSGTNRSGTSSGDRLYTPLFILRSGTFKLAQRPPLSQATAGRRTLRGWGPSSTRKTRVS